MTPRTATCHPDEAPVDWTWTAQLSVVEPRSWVKVTPAVSLSVVDVEETEEEEEGQPLPEKTRRDILGAVGGAAWMRRGVRTRGRRRVVVEVCMIWLCESFWIVFVAVRKG